MRSLTFQEAVETLVEKLSQQDEKGFIAQPAHRAFVCQTGVAVLALLFEEAAGGNDLIQQTLARVEARVYRDK